MDAAVRHAVTLMGASLADALVMASATPARFLGLQTQRGTIAPGCGPISWRWTPALSVAGVWIGGQAAF